MYRYLVFCFLLLCTVTSSGQRQLLFFQEFSGKSVTIQQGHKATLLYKGYNGQMEVFSEMVTEITDSTVTLGADLSKVSKRFKPGRMKRNTFKVIRIQDITGFRKMGLGRQLLKTTVRVGEVIGTAYFLGYIYASDLSAGTAFLISMGTGFTIIGVNSVLFPENIKHYMQDGWQVKSIPAF